ncbi:hypothetical protein [Streptomyces sp. NPDC094032]|uniref:hypothetical protein n=1 Tax=Streptomyces sp. NPDC094032 TaxID=3155308 RepID=UPI003320D844
MKDAKELAVSWTIWVIIAVWVITDIDFGAPRDFWDNTRLVAVALWALGCVLLTAKAIVSRKAARGEKTPRG